MRVQKCKRTLFLCKIIVKKINKKSSIPLTAYKDIRRGKPQKGEYMKKLTRIFIIILWTIHIIMNAETEKEVIKKEYIELEENIHYEKDVENNCEYYDKNNYIVGDWIYKFEKPEEKNYREIVKETKEIKLDRNIINRLKITSFDGNGSSLNIHEFIITDINGEKLNYKIKNLDYVNTDLIEDNNKDNSSTFIESECLDKLCNMKININEEKLYKETINIKKIMYKYRDSYYKCYSPKTINLENYIKELGYTKQNENKNYKQIYSDNLISNNDNNFEIKSEDKPKNILLEKEIIESVNDENEKLALLTKYEDKKTKNYTEIYILTFILLVLITIGIFLTKKVKKCRTK